MIMDLNWIQMRMRSDAIKSWSMEGRPPRNRPSLFLPLIYRSNPRQLGLLIHPYLTVLYLSLLNPARVGSDCGLETS